MLGFILGEGVFHANSSKYTGFSDFLHPPVEISPLMVQTGRVLVSLFRLKKRFLNDAAKTSRRMPFSFFDVIMFSYTFS